MNKQDFNYREHLIDILKWIRHTNTHLFAVGMQLAMEGELSYLHDILKDGDEIPGDLDYLRAVEDETVANLVKMMEELIKTQDSVANLNAIAEEEYLSQEDDEELEKGEVGEFPEDFDYRLEAEMDIYENILVLFTSIYQLAKQSDYQPHWIPDYVLSHYFDADLEIESDDQNVQLLLSGLNEALKVLALTVIYQ